MGTGRSWVKQVKSNVKGGCDVALGEKTLIVGPNGIGKSTITQAVELALTGTVSDVAGRAIVAQDATLVTLLAPPGAAKLTAEAVLSDGRGASWSGVPGRRAAHTIFSGIDRDRVLPLRAVREALLGSPESGRKWLVSRIEAGGDLADTVARLEAARKRQRDETARSLSLRTAASVQAGGLPPEGSAPAEAADPLAPLIADRESRLAAAEARLLDAEERVRAAEAARAKLPAPGGNALAGIGAALLAALDVQIDGGFDRCPVCTSEQALDVARARRAKVAGKIEGLVAAERAWREAGAAVDAARLDYGAARAEIDGLVTEVKRLRAVPKEPSADAAALAARWAGVRALEAQATEAENAAGAAASEVATLQAALADATDAARADFERRVQAYLPAGDTFGLDLHDGEREVFRVGLRRQGLLHAALSGSEWARVTAAIAAACLPASGPAVVIPEERAFDPETLGHALLAFDAIRAQVIVTSPVMPATVPAGWTVIEVAPREAPLPFEVADAERARIDAEPKPAAKPPRKPRKPRAAAEPAAPAAAEPAPPPGPTVDSLFD